MAVKHMFYLTHDVPNRFLPARSNALEKLSVCLTKPITYLQAAPITATRTVLGLVGIDFECII